MTDHERHKRYVRFYEFLLAVGVGFFGLLVMYVSVLSILQA